MELIKINLYLYPQGQKWKKTAKKLNMKIACEIFADRNYEDDGNLVSEKNLMLSLLILKKQKITF